MAMHKTYHGRRWLADASLIGVVLLLAICAELMRGHGIVHDWSVLLSTYAHNIAHWVADVSGAEITVTVLLRRFAAAAH